MAVSPQRRSDQFVSSSCHRASHRDCGGSYTLRKITGHGRARRTLPPVERVCLCWCHDGKAAE